MLGADLAGGGKGRAASNGNRGARTPGAAPPSAPPPPPSAQTSCARRVLASVWESMMDLMAASVQRSKTRTATGRGREAAAPGRGATEGRAACRGRAGAAPAAARGAGATWARIGASTPARGPAAVRRMVVVGGGKGGPWRTAVRGRGGRRCGAGCATRAKRPLRRREGRPPLLRPRRSCVGTRAAVSPPSGIPSPSPTLRLTPLPFQRAVTVRATHSSPSTDSATVTTAFEGAASTSGLGSGSSEAGSGSSAASAGAAAGAPSALTVAPGAAAAAKAAACVRVGGEGVGARALPSLSPSLPFSVLGHCSERLVSTIGPDRSPRGGRAGARAAPPAFNVWCRAAGRLKAGRAVPRGGRSSCGIAPGRGGGRGGAPPSHFFLLP